MSDIRGIHFPTHKSSSCTFNFGVTLPKAIDDIILSSTVDLYYGVMTIILNGFRVGLIYTHGY